MLTTPEDFIQSCKARMSKKDVDALVVKASFSTVEWLKIYREYRYATGFRVMQIIVMKKAIENASTLVDWVAIARHVHANGQLLHRACEEVLRFDPTDEDIILLRKCGVTRLQSVGWYLAGRRKLLSK